MTIGQTSQNIKDKAVLFSNVVNACKFLFKNSPLAQETREYTLSRVSNFNQEKFDFGFFPKNEDLNLLIDLVGYDTLHQLGLIYPWNIADRASTFTINKGSLSNHNLVMPIRDDYGNIVAMMGRSLFSNEKLKELEIQKYKYTQFFKSLYLFGLYQSKKAIRNSDSVILVEGQIDCITCHAHGFHNVVALGGASLSQVQFYLLNKYTNNIYLLLDNDKAGIIGRKKIMDRYSKLSNIRLLNLPEKYKDPDEYLKTSNNYNIFNYLAA